MGSGRDDFNYLVKYMGLAVCLPAMCYMIYPIVLIILSHAHLDDTECDTVDNGVGIAQWMYGMGICNAIIGCTACVPSFYIVVTSQMGADTIVNKFAMPCVALCACLGFCFQLGWVIYGSMVVFKDHPDDTGCPLHVHAVV